jgi:hypothetical protein
MDTTQQLGLVVLALGGLWKAWPLIKEKLLPAITPGRRGPEGEALDALAAAQTLHAYLARRPGCKKSLETLDSLTMGNFMPQSPAVPPAVPPATAFVVVPAPESPAPVAPQ